MNPEHYDRLNILKEIEGTFPGLPTPQVLDLAQWVEGNGTPAIKLQTPEVGIWRSEDNGNAYFTDTKPSDRSAVRVDTIANLDVSKITNTVAREFRKAGMSAPRKWTNLDAIPSTVQAITDKDGDRAEPQVVLGKRAWVFTDAPFHGVPVSPDDGPFTEVPISRAN